MIIILRALFGLVTAFLCFLASIVLGTFVTKGHDNEHCSVAKTTAVVLSSLLVGVFATLYFAQIGLV